MEPASGACIQSSIPGPLPLKLVVDRRSTEIPSPPKAGGGEDRVPYGCRGAAAACGAKLASAVVVVTTGFAGKVCDLLLNQRAVEDPALVNSRWAVRK